MFGQSLLSAFGIACTTDTDQLFNPTSTQINSLATYQLNNATTSIPSNTYPGTPSNITYTTGKFGDAAVFNGSNTGINIGASNNFASNKLTISFWANPGTANPSNYQLLFSNYIGGSLADYDFIINRQSPNHASNAEKLEVGISGSGSAYLYILTDSAVFTPGTWKNYVIVFDTTESANVDKVKIYVNGTLEARSDVSSSGNVTGSLLDVSDDLLIGTWPHDTSHRYSGIMDQVRIFNSALPQSAVTALYNETTTTAQNPYITEEVYSGIAYYKMSDATDQLGNYNGTATNVNFNTEGKFGFAGAFNGSSSKIDTNVDFSGSTATGATISFWFKTSNTSGQTILGSQTGNPSGFAYGSQIYLGNSFSAFPDESIAFVNERSGATEAFLTREGSTAYADGNWHHAVFISTNSSKQIWIDGVSKTVYYTSSGSVSAQADLIDIALGTSLGGSWFNGSIDQVRIYDSALSAANVSTLYKEVECEPAAINALANFNTVLYTGDDVSHSITNVGFKPGFTWIKRRVSGSESHALYDNIRGINKQLSSDSNGIEATNTAPYEGFTSFDDDGFTVDNNGATNRAPNTYAAWNWKAPLANLSTNFNGSSSYIQSTSLGTYFAGNNTLSISFWFKSTTDAFQTLVSFSDTNDASTEMSVIIRGDVAGDELAIFNRNGGSYNIEANNTGSGSVIDGKWHHAVLTGDSNGNKLYFNGSQLTSITYAVGSSSTTLAMPSDINSFSIGANFDSGGAENFTNGQIAQVRIFNDVLTASEVSDLYTEPAASNNTLNYPAGAGCIAAYPLQTDAVDLSGTYNGTASNVTFNKPGYLTGNTDGTIPSTVAANQEAGFSVVQWTSPSGNGNPSNVGHGLSKAPELIFYKGINYADNWYVYSQPTGLNKYLNLNTPGAVVPNNSNGFTNINSSTFTTNLVNGSNNILSYCFTSIPGYSKIGSYVGTSSAGNFQYTEFEPSWLMVKCSSVGGRDWVIFDDKRISGSSYYELYPNTSGAENGPYPDVTLNSTGFTLGSNASFSNRSGDTYIFLAIA